MYEKILKKSLMLWDMIGHHPEHFIYQAALVSWVLMATTLALALYQMFQDSSITSILASVASCGIVYVVGYCILTICFVIILGYFGYLPLPCYIPSEINFYLFASYNNFAIMFTLFIVGSMHCFIFCNIMFLITQFKLLNKAFSVIDYNEISPLQKERRLQRVRNCVEYHNFLLRCCTEFSSLIGLSYVQFISLLTLVLCILAYIVATQHELLLIMKSMTYFVGIALTHLFLYCLPSKHLSTEVSKLSDSIYFSNWYDCRQLPITKSLLIIMARTQRETVISFRGLVKMDLAIFISSLKMAFSVYTFLRSLKN